MFRVYDVAAQVGEVADYECFVFYCSLSSVSLFSVHIVLRRMSLSVKEFWKSVTICQSYYQKWKGLFFETRFV